MKRFTRVLSAVLVFALIMGLNPILTPFAMAADKAGSINSILLTSVEPPPEESIPISNRAQLEAIKDNPNGKYHLTTDIDLRDIEWEPLGNENAPFRGTFDGQGYVIRNMTITGDKHGEIGLFGYISGATIKNVGLANTNININGYVCVGGVCGVALFGNISNCYNSGAITASNSNHTYLCFFCNCGWDLR